MAKFVFDQCCFCVDLRIGCFIIGYLNLIGSALATISSIVVVAGGAVLSTSDQEHREVGAGLLVAGIILLLLFAVLLAFAIVLLVGLHKRKPGHLKAYLIYSYIFLAIQLILLIVNLATGNFDGSTIASSIVSLLIGTYFVMVIRSYYYQMLEDSTTGA